MTSKLFVRNLPYQTTQSDLHRLFSEHGKVVSATIATDRDSGRPRGFGFVEMNSDAEAEAAINALNNQTLAGRTLYVAVSQPKERSGGSRGSRR